MSCQPSIPTDPVSSTCRLTQFEIGPPERCAAKRICVANICFAPIKLIASLKCSERSIERHIQFKNRKQ